MDNKELNEFLSRDIKRLVGEVLRFAVTDRAESAFLLRFISALRGAEQRRRCQQEQGRHVPAFLISSITRSCNLHCRGCYARENGICGEEEQKPPLTAEQWEDIFCQARELGVCFDLLAGGEPLLRRDVLEAAGRVPEIIFPVFTNGMLIDDDYIALFRRHRNLLPVLSLEGGRDATDHRRGQGLYDALLDKMSRLRQAGLLLGASLTVTGENLGELISPEFVDGLRSRGCRLLFYIEYVPADRCSQGLCLTDEQRLELARGLAALKERYPGLFFLSFPGDEDKMGGCLAAGRGFFHIGPGGDAEACPFSPYGDCNAATDGLAAAMDSPFFRRLRADALLSSPHSGGCTLFAGEEQVKQLL